jgi:hypothetical protein
VPRQITDLQSNQVYKLDLQLGLFRVKLMVILLRLLVALFAGCFRSRRDLVLENLALQRLGVFKRNTPVAITMLRVSRCAWEGLILRLFQFGPDKPFWVSNVTASPKERKLCCNPTHKSAK